jgi:hypothetical protein
MGQMKETLHDTPEAEAYQEHVERVDALNKLAHDLLGQISQVEFTVRVMHDNVVELLKGLTDGAA